MRPQFAPHPATRLVIRNVDMTEWEAWFIDGNVECDVATFRVSDTAFEAIKIRPLRCEMNKWPPPPPAAGCGVFLHWIPEVDRRVLRHNAVEFLQQSNRLLAASVGPDEIEMVADPRYLNSGHSRQRTPTTKNLSGFSGAPLLVVSAALGQPFWLGGIIINQMHARTESEPTHIWARRTDCIMPDGRIRKPRYVLD